MRLHVADARITLEFNPSSVWGPSILLIVRTGGLLDLIGQDSNFQPLSSHGGCKLIAKILQHSKKYIFFANLTKIGIIFIRSHWMAIVTLAVGSF